jgi:ABC-type nitrate/sulfonate/bicarbonate transport system substrate-binding protein
MLFKKILLCLCLLAPGLTIGQNLVKMKAGMVAGVDQIGLPIALERGFFEKWGLDVTISRPYATGVDALNSLQAGENDMLQVGVPMIGAVLRGIDLVALGNYSGSAHKMGGDATIALIAGSTSGIVKGDLKTLKGKKIAASFGTINHLYVLGLLEKAGLTPADVTCQHATTRYDSCIACKRH